MGERCCEVSASFIVKMGGLIEYVRFPRPFPLKVVPRARAKLISVE
jgi:hypothetical protein